jgi:hypothetical protein
MSKNPLINALAAFFYITLIVLVLQYGSKFIPDSNSSLIVPIAMLSLFSLSAAMMAYIFGYYPLILFFDKKRTEAVDLFLKTTLIFGSITAGILIILFSGVLG